MRNLVVAFGLLFAATSFAASEKAPVGNGNFRRAEANFAMILPYINKATDQQVVDLLNASYENKQICHAGLCARDYLPPLFRSHEQYLQLEVRADLAQILAQYAVPPPVPR